MSCEVRIATSKTADMLTEMGNCEVFKKKNIHHWNRYSI